jgi:hypothetical protein
VNDERASVGKTKHDWIPGAWSRAAACWRWRERAEAWDELERQRARAAHAQAVDEMNRRHVQEGQALQNKGLQALKAMEPTRLSATEAVRCVVDGTKLERTARGEPETVHEQRLTGKDGGPITCRDAALDAATLEELRELRAIRERLERRLAESRRDRPPPAPEESV